LIRKKVIGMIYEFLKSIFKRKEYYQVPKKIATTVYTGYIITAKELPVNPRIRRSKATIRAIRYPGSYIFFDKRSVHKFMRETLVQRSFDVFKVYKVSIYPLNIETDERIRYAMEVDRGDLTFYVNYSELCGDKQIEYDIAIDQNITIESRIESFCK